MSLTTLPDNLPVPVDDGLCNHLEGAKLKEIFLHSISGTVVNLAQLSGWSVLYIFPMIGRPDIPLPYGWNEVPGARGCTPQSCSFRDQYSEFANYGITLFGISSQDEEYLNSAAARLHLQFELLSDKDFSLVSSLKIPTFILNGETYFKRITLIVHDDEIRKVFYPVFPPDKNVDDVLDWFNLNVKKAS